MRISKKIPYNPLLLISGIVMGLYYHHLSILGEAILLISQAEPHGILAIFLPILIFEGAFKTEWHVFKKFIGQSLIIGVLSSVVGPFLIMLAIKLIIDVNDVISE
jgi:NhaP-type Na+/H+ or K+/H+ antiporter